MKLTKERLQQIIKEELENIVEGEDDTDEILAAMGSEEEQQPLVEVANDALHAASEAITDLSWAIEEEGFKFNRDSPVTLADLDYKVEMLNHHWSELKGSQ